MAKTAQYFLDKEKQISLNTSGSEKKHQLLILQIELFADAELTEPKKKAIFLQFTSFDAQAKTALQSIDENDLTCQFLTCMQDDDGENLNYGLNVARQKNAACTQAYLALLTQLIAQGKHAAVLLSLTQCRSDSLNSGWNFGCDISSSRDNNCIDAYLNLLTALINKDQEEGVLAVLMQQNQYRLNCGQYIALGNSSVCVDKYLVLLDALIDKGKSSEVVALLQQTTIDGHTVGDILVKSEDHVVQKYVALLAKLIQQGKSSEVLTLLQQQDNTSFNFGQKLCVNRSQDCVDAYMRVLQSIVTSGHSLGVLVLLNQTTNNCGRYNGITLGSCITLNGHVSTESYFKLLSGLINQHASQVIALLEKRSPHRWRRRWEKERNRDMGGLIFQKDIPYYLSLLNELSEKIPQRVFELVTKKDSIKDTIAGYSLADYAGGKSVFFECEPATVQLFENVRTKSAFTAIKLSDYTPFKDVLTRYQPYKQDIVKYLLALPDNDSSTLALLKRCVSKNILGDFFAASTGTGLARAILGEKSVAVAKINAKIAAIERPTSSSLPVDSVTVGQKSHGTTKIPHNPYGEKLGNFVRRLYGITP